MPNSQIKSKGDSYTVGAQDMEQMATTGVNQFRAVSSNQTIDLDKVASNAKDILSKYRGLAGKEAADKETKNKDFPGGTMPKDMNMPDPDKDIEKRVQDNTRDESNTERPFGWKDLKPFGKGVKANLFLKMKKIESLLNATQAKKSTFRNERNRLRLLQAKVSNDIEVLAGMENSQWNNPQSKQEKDPDKDYEKFMKPEQTGEQKNNLNDLLAKANLSAWSAPESLKKKAMEEMDKTQQTNIRQALTELKKNDEEYSKDIQMLEQVIGQEAKVSDEDMAKIKRIAMEDIEDKKDEKKEEKEDEKDEKEEDKKEEDKGDKEDKKEDKKDDKKKDKEDKDSKDKKFPMKKKPMAPMKDKEDQPEKPEKPEMEMGGEGGAPKMPMPPVKDDLTAEFNRAQTKSASYWTIKDRLDNEVLKFSGANAFGKEVYNDWDTFSSEAYGHELLARIRQNGFKQVAELVNGQLKMTVHASLIEKDAVSESEQKKIDEKKEKKEEKKEKQEVKEEEEKKKKEEKKEKEEKDKEDKEDKKDKEKKEKKEAKADPKVLNDAFKGAYDGDAKSYGKKWISLYRKKAEKLAEKNKELSAKLEKVESEKDGIQEEQTLRIKAERALTLANKMQSKSMITAEDLEPTVEKLTLMDDLSYSMMEKMVEQNKNEVVEAAVEKHASKVKSGVSHLILQTASKPGGLKEKLSDIFSQKPKHIKLREAFDEYNKKNK